MPTPRRPRPTPSSQPPLRRPRVAGLRKPGEAPSPSPRTEPRHAAPDEAEEWLASEQEVASEPETTTVEENLEQPVPEAAPPTDARPSPRAKVPDSGRVKPTSEDETLVDDEPPTYEPPSYQPRRDTSVYNLAPALAAVALVLALVAAFFAYKWLSSSGSSANAAHVDAPRTAEVKQQVTEAVEALFSYDYQDLGKTEKAADDLLTNSEVKATYGCLLGEVKRLAPEQKMVATVRVSRIAPIHLDEENATLLVFVEQSAVRDGSTEDGSYGGGQLTISTVRGENDKWKISEIDAYEDKRIADCKAAGDK